MSINNIQLSPALLAALYPSVLIEPVATAPSVPPLPVLGDNKKKIVIVVSCEEGDFPEGTELAFLTSILAACKLSLADVAVINQKKINQKKETSPLSYTFLCREFGSRTVILFDVAPESIDLPFHFPHFQAQEFDGCTYLAAPSLKEIEEQKAAKQKLWSCLKTIFHL